MKYELGDKVNIKKYWRKKSLPEGFGEQLKENEEEERKFDKYELVSCNEIGYVIGIRSLKISTTLAWVFEESVDVGFGLGTDYHGIRETNSEHTTVYLVGTRMNCLRKVNKDDIELISDALGR